MASIRSQIIAALKRTDRDARKTRASLETAMKGLLYLERYGTTNEQRMAEKDLDILFIHAKALDKMIKQL